jgi:hypothetical protein
MDHQKSMPQGFDTQSHECACHKSSKWLLFMQLEKTTNSTLELQEQS